MNGPETAKAAAEFRKHLRSSAYAKELAEDRAARAAMDRRAGHLPTCSLTRCVPECPTHNRQGDHHA